MNAQPARSRNFMVGVLLFLAAMVIGLGTGAFIFLSQSTAADPNSPAYSTLPPATYVSSAPAPVAGAPAPDFTLKTLGGDAVTLSKFRGEPVLINFWASWCVPCRLETPDLVRAYEQHKSEGLVLLGVNLTAQDTLPEAEAFTKEFKISYPVPLDQTGKVAGELYRVLGLPTSVFVNRAGVITRVNVGAMTGAQIDQYLGEVLK